MRIVVQYAPAPALGNQGFAPAQSVKDDKAKF